MMMFSLYVQQNQWITITLLAGTALMLLFLLVYHAMWRPREEESKTGSRIEIRGIISFLQWLLTFMPAALILLMIASVVYTATHLLAAASEPPNW